MKRVNPKILNTGNAPSDDALSSIVTQAPRPLSSSKKNSNLPLTTSAPTPLSTTGSRKISGTSGSSSRTPIQTQRAQGGMLNCLFACFSSPPPVATEKEEILNSSKKMNTNNTSPTTSSSRDDSARRGGGSSKARSDDDDNVPAGVIASLPRGSSNDALIRDMQNMNMNNHNNNNNNSNNNNEAQPSSGLLPQLLPKHKGKKTLVLDLDETLVHSSFRPVSVYDFSIQVEIEGTVHNVYVSKRPYVDEFMEHVAKNYEVVVFTASLGKYANPLLDILDVKNTVTHRLYREHCVQYRGVYIKDMTLMNRKIEDIMIVDNSAASYMFQPENAIPIESWYDDLNDKELLTMLPSLDTLATCDNCIEELVMLRKKIPSLRPPNGNKMFVK